eukprot:203466-Pelagomonas_calceolata.AAC.1
MQEQRNMAPWNPLWSPITIGCSSLQPGGLTAQLSGEANRNTKRDKATDTQRKVGCANNAATETMVRLD